MQYTSTLFRKSQLFAISVSMYVRNRIVGRPERIYIGLAFDFDLNILYFHLGLKGCSFVQFAPPCL